MNSRNLMRQLSEDAVANGAVIHDAETTLEGISHASDNPPTANARLLKGLSPFWRDRMSWKELRDRFGPFTLPIVVFLLAAGFSVVIAYEHQVALRAFREEVLDPVLYLLLAMFCLRTRQDITRLLFAMLASGLAV